MDKEQGQMEHAIFQAERRYGVKLVEHEVKHIANMIKRGYSHFVSRSSNRIVKHIVVFRDTRFFVAYDTKRHTVATFLPKNSPEFPKKKSSGMFVAESEPNH